MWTQTKFIRLLIVQDLEPAPLSSRNCIARRVRVSTVVLGIGHGTWTGIKLLIWVGATILNINKVSMIRLSLSLSMWTRTELRRIGMQSFEPGTRSTQVEELHCPLCVGIHCCPRYRSWYMDGY